VRTLIITPAAASPSSTTPITHDNLRGARYFK
jgi:hypothetical protein